MNETNRQTDHAINIIGDGSIGHLLTGYLLKSGNPVSLFSRTTKPSRKVILSSAESGLTFDFTTHTKPLSQFDSNNPAIITAKAHQLEAVCKRISGLNNRPHNVILMMNGLGLIELCQKWLTDIPVVQAATTQAAKLILSSTSDQASIEHTGFGETILGDFNDPLSDNNLNRPIERSVFDPVIQTLNLALPPVTWGKEHHLNLWLKLLVNAIINPLTAINNVNNGALVERSELSLAVQQLAEELSPILSHIQSDLTWQTLHNRVLEVAGATAKNSSSMRQDLLFGRKTEIDFITGYILKKAQRFGCSLPSHERLYQQVKHLENQTQTSVTK